MFHHEISPSRDFPPHNSAVVYTVFTIVDDLTTLFTLVGGSEHVL
jgi:hypothetical protein